MLLIIKVKHIPSDNFTSLLLQAIKKRLEEKHSEVQIDDEFPIQFQDDVITLSIPTEGVEINGWKISCRHHPNVSCEINFNTVMR